MTQKYNPSRGGHAGGHLRDAFLDWLERFSNSETSEPLPEVYIDDKPVTLNWLIGQLWNCTDLMPNSGCETLKDMGIECNQTYASAVRTIGELEEIIRGLKR